MFLPAAYGDEEGFTLIEFLIAIVILTVGLLGLLESVNLAISQNASNKMRSDAVLIADEMMSRERVRPFSNISSVNTTRTINNGIFSKTYSISKVVTDMGGTPTTSKNVRLTVSWKEKTATKSHNITTIISNVP